MDLGQQLAVYLGVFLLVWYAIAAAYNRRRGVRVYRWLQPGLKSLGSITEAKWIGSSGSGARLVVGKPGRPYRRIEVAFLLETRELLPLWLINRVRGRRDALILRADLRSSPRAELEVMPYTDPRLKGLSGSARDRNPWVLSSVELPGGFQAAQRGRVSDTLLDQVRVFLEGAGTAVRRLSFAMKSPHLILEANLPELMQAPPEAFFELLQTAFGGSVAAAEG